MNLSKTKLYLLAKSSPQLAILEFMKEMESRIPAMFTAYVNENLPKVLDEIWTKHDQNLINEATSTMLENLAFKGEKGDMGEKGDVGDTPIKGRDYFTPSEIENMVKHIQSLIVIPPPKNGITPLAGLDYPSYEEVDKMVRLLVEKIPRYDETVVLNKLRQEFPKLELKGEEVVQKINGLPIKPEFQIDASHIKNLPKVMGRARQISGAGKGAGLGTAALLTISGTIDDSNVTFTATEEPVVLIINGPMYRKTGGAITWSWAGSIITLSTPVGTNGAIYGIR